jgi:hypothetical protein
MHSTMAGRSNVLDDLDLDIRFIPARRTTLLQDETDDCGPQTGGTCGSECAPSCESCDTCGCTQTCDTCTCAC